MRALPRTAVFAAALAALVAGAQDIHINDSSTIREVQRVYVNDSSTIREIQRIYVNDSGTIRLVYQNAVYDLPDVGAGDTGFASGSNSAQACITFDTDGTWEAVGTNDGLQESGNYVTPTSLAANYTIRASLVSGSTPSPGSALDTDLALTSLRSWCSTQVGEGSVGATLDFTLKEAGVTRLTSQASVGAQVLPF
jgi:hypothetical protein